MVKKESVINPAVYFYLWVNSYLPVILTYYVELCTRLKDTDLY